MEKGRKAYSKTREIISRYGMALVFVLPFLLFFVCFNLTPILMGVYLSLFNYNSAQPDAKQFVGINNYVNLFANNDILAQTFWPALGKTFLFAIVTVPIMLIVPLFLAILISWKPPGYKVFRSIIYLPCILSISTAGILFVSIFRGDQDGLFNAFFGTNINFLEEEPLRWFVMILLSIWWQSGTNFVILSAALKNIPKNLYEACESDGGGRLSSFVHVTLPGIKGSLGLCLFNTLIGYLGLYGQPVVIHGDINATNIETPMMLLQGWLGDTTYSKLTGYLTAVGIVFGLFIMVASLIERKVMSIEKGGHRHENRYQALRSFEK